MPDGATTAAPAQPDPNPDRTEAHAAATEPTRSGKLRSLLRRLIDYATDLSKALCQRDKPDRITKISFGTADLALIVRRITLGIMRATALDDRIAADAARLDSRPGPLPRQPPEARTPPEQPAQPAKPRKPRTRHPRLDALLGLPSVHQVAADVARRPIGAVLADICRDLGITTAHPLWFELYRAVLAEGGSVIRLTAGMLRKHRKIGKELPRDDGPTRTLWVRHRPPPAVSAFAAEASFAAAGASATASSTGPP